MEPNTLPQQNTGDLAILSAVGNPLDAPVLPVSETLATVTAPAYVTPIASATNQASNTSTSITTASIVTETPYGTITPPTPIETNVGIAPAPITETSTIIKPHGSGILGITIGIFFLISLIVGASLYYYFYMYKKEVVPVPIKPDLSQTLIKKVVPVPEVAVETVANQIEENIALDTAVTTANNDSALADNSLASFDEALK